MVSDPERGRRIDELRSPERTGQSRELRGVERFEGHRRVILEEPADPPPDIKRRGSGPLGKPSFEVCP
jgi:hypothetical protein